MRCATSRSVYSLAVLASLSACGSMPPDQQAGLQQALSVACTVDGVIVPFARPVVATLGTAGATAAGVDSLLVHPAVVAACQQLGGTPAIAAPVSPPASVPPDGSITPSK
jgi:hypothetical protein